MSRGDIRFSSSEGSAGSVPGEDHIHLTFFLGIASPLPPVPEFPARQVVGADVLPGLRWMLAPAAVAGHRLASALRLLLRLLRPLHEHLGAVPEVRLPPRRPGPACSGVVRGRSTGAGHVRRGMLGPSTWPLTSRPYLRPRQVGTH